MTTGMNPKWFKSANHELFTGGLIGLLWRDHNDPDSMFHGLNARPVEDADGSGRYTNAIEVTVGNSRFLITVSEVT